MLTIFSLLGSSTGPLVSAQTPTATQKPAPTPTTTQKPATAPTPPAGQKPATTQSQPPAAKPATDQTPAAAAAAPAEVDPWPRAFTTKSGAGVIIYQPQVASWTDQKHAVLYAAVAYAASGAKEPALGSLKVESDTSVALDERLVSFSEFKITESNFPTLPRETLKTTVEEIVAAVPLEERVISLERVLANIDSSQIFPKNVEGLKADPPPISFSKTPAVLVNFDGDPIWAPIPQNDLKAAVNTNWDLFEHGPTKTYYLRNEKVWLKTSDVVKGSWSPAGTLPASFGKLPADDNWKDVKASLPGQSTSGKMPKVFVSLVPAELILLQGEPSYLAVQGAKELLWVNNTESDVFRMGLKGPVYYLVAGRWFSAPDFTGPWTFATTSLPADFKQIPLEHPRSRVLASVPGTTQAAEAVLLAQIPQTARVSRTLQAPEVAYQGGTPEFQPIEKTTVQRAINTDKDIFKIGDLYYMCVPGRVVHGQGGNRAMGGDRRGAEGDLRDPGELAVTLRHLRDRAGVERRRRGLRDGGGVHGSDGRLGLHGVGHRLLLPAVLRVLRRLPVLLRALSDLRLRRLLQSLDRRLHARGGCLRSLRRRRRGRPLQSADRHLFARRDGLRPIRRTWRGHGVQPAHRHLRRDPAGLERLRQLGLDRACNGAISGPTPRE